MATVGDQIKSANDAICDNIQSLSDQRGLLSQNILAQLRNLVEAVAVRVHLGADDVEFTYGAVGPALGHVRSNAHLNFVGRFHKLIQQSASHYTMDGDSSERLLLKYFEQLHRIRNLLKTTCGSPSSRTSTPFLSISIRPCGSTTRRLPPGSM
jgi:hypothetical protein